MFLKQKATLFLALILLMGLLTGFATPSDIDVSDVSLVAENCGIELVKTDDDSFSYTYLGVEDPSSFSVTITEANGRIKITAIGPYSWDGNYQMQVGSEYHNVVRVYVPNQKYGTFEINCTQAPIRLPDLQARVELTGSRGSVTVVDEVLQDGTWIIKNDAGSVRIEADFISSEFYISNQGSMELRFRRQPMNLALYLIDCAGVVKVPDGWTRAMLLGNGAPGIWIQNKGDTTVTVSK